MWAYIAGLFDGDGSFGIHQSKSNSRISLRLFAKISGSKSEEEFSPIINFLTSNGIRATFQKGNRGKDEFGYRRRSTNVVQICSFDSIQKFVEGIYPHIIFKKEHCNIMLKALNLRLELKSKGYGSIKKNMKSFDVFRHELHDLSVKGPRTLKPW